MRAGMIGQDQSVYFVLADDGKRYQFSSWDWLEKIHKRWLMPLILCVKGIVLNLLFLFWGNNRQNNHKR